MSEPRLFMHRLALSLGKTVSELLATLTPIELRDWLQFDRQAGLPDIAAQWQRAVGISVAAAGLGGSLEVSDYIPLSAWDAKPATAQDIAKAFTDGS